MLWHSKFCKGTRIIEATRQARFSRRDAGLSSLQGLSECGFAMRKWRNCAKQRSVRRQSSFLHHLWLYTSDLAFIPKIIGTLPRK